jgi:hypothetical protein
VITQTAQGGRVSGLVDVAEQVACRMHGVGSTGSWYCWQLQIALTHTPLAPGVDQRVDKAGKGTP